jgi:WD40 repeat protein
VCKSYEGVAFDAAGRLMVVVTYRATSGKVVALPAQLRLAHGGRLLRTLSGTGSLANAANISPDGKLVATLDDHDRIGVWDSATGRRLTLFEGHAGRRTQWGPATVVFKFSPDGSLILSTDDSGLMLVWQARTGRVLNRIQGAARPPGAGYAEWGGAISPNDALFVTTADWDTGGPSTGSDSPSLCSNWSPVCSAWMTRPSITTGRCWRASPSRGLVSGTSTRRVRC